MDEIKANQVQIEENWRTALAQEFEKPYFLNIKQQLVTAHKSGKVVYPKGSLIFNAFNTTPFDAVKVVILGQDPYHNPDEAMGLSFSVPKGVRIPPSLRNIYKEINRDLGIEMPNHGDLTDWAQRGVLLLNAMLTVEHKTAGSHKNLGWQTFTDVVIQTLSDQKKGLIFMLWGNFAKSKKVFIDASKHHILEAPHPSPLAQGFSGCSHFSKANALLKGNGKVEIDWGLV